jgi:hypothetical protein
MVLGNLISFHVLLWGPCSTDEYIFPGTYGSMPKVPETRRPEDYVQRKPLTSTSSTSTLVFDDEEKGPNYQSSDADEDTDGVAHLGGNR